jgi:hypothetical protein
MSTMTLLKRSKIRKEQVDLDVELYRKAHALLNYSEAISANTQKTSSEQILEKLEKLGIRPFTDETVRSYKFCKRFVGWYLAAPLVPIALWTGMTLAMNHTESVVLPVILGISGVLATILAICSLIYGLSWDWRIREFYNFYNAIPEFVLQTAVDIKEAIPEAQLRIVELYQRELTPADPFLILRLPSGRDLYLEVWNEPGFKHKRVV